MPLLALFFIISLKSKLHQRRESHIQKTTVIDYGNGNYSLSICASCVLVETPSLIYKRIDIDVGIMIMQSK